ncbi:dihydropteroate synthase [Mycetocola miduiensis]|uniref:Dihydropteroate synthase n=1 Tax=Mycetocola miduiensis TaxID=995034 RepID=A0A1I5B9A1_9MICO|nr:dihydropteroate synthase [Mycetocola miduiensis]SFN71283.1 dihydropteroate synthase [Mycetocola miduiensis]
MTESIPAPMLVMGILNVTPNSFSDGGQYLDHAAAIAHGRSLVADGADLIDVGGESTRPGAERIGSAEEQRRILPVLRALSADGIRLSVDTMNADTARASVKAGAEIINDVSGGLADPLMASVAAESGALFLLSHWRGHSTEMDSRSDYDDVVSDVRAELVARLAAVEAAGVARERIILDPGLGFAKTSDHNWEILSRLDELQSIGLPLLIGASRKRFVGALLEDGASMTDRDLPTAVISALLADTGIWGLRVHNVRATAVALAVHGRLSGTSRPRCA